VAARSAPGCQWTASVCTGAGLYAAAGLLEGKKTTTHWGFRDNLRAMGVEVVADRVVWQGNHISGAEVSAGIDMALALTEHVHGRKLAESLQLVIEYDPQPPFDTGAPTKADASTLRLALRVLLGDRPFQAAVRINRESAGVAIEACRPRAVEAAARGKSALLGCADAIAGGAALCSTSQSRIPPRGTTLLDPDLWSTR
jgi:DJ-1/PfpI family